MTATPWPDRWSRRLALFFGIGLAIQEVAYNWGDPSWWPFILVDYIAAGLLVYGALRDDRILAAGWGFACAMFYMAFFLMLEEGKTPFPLMLGVGAEFGITVGGLGLTVFSTRRDRKKRSSDERSGESANYRTDR